MSRLQTFFLLSAALVCWWTSMAQNSNTSNAKSVISLTITAVHDSVKAGTPILVKITLKNISNHDIKLARDNAGRDSHLDVRDADGNLAPDTLLGSVWNGHVANPAPAGLPIEYLEGNLVIGTLKPQDTDTWEVDAFKFYEMSHSVKYVIQARWRDPESLSLVVKSNTITVTVTP